MTKERKIKLLAEILFIIGILWQAFTNIFSGFNFIGSNTISLTLLAISSFIQLYLAKITQTIGKVNLVFGILFSITAIVMLVLDLLSI